uniref:RNase H type-1 domain-containing protein n=1 Tax=Fagus sylvatica TaxID=28930 RepID=A0A2N9F066_FAGSY
MELVVDIKVDEISMARTMRCGYPISSTVHPCSEGDDPLLENIASDFTNANLLQIGSESHKSQRGDEAPIAVNWFGNVLAKKLIQVFLPIQSFSILISSCNCHGALNRNFRRTITDLVNTNSPAILIVTETRVGGARTKGITNSLLLDGAIHVDTVGYAGGLWLRWNSLAVDIIHLASTEPEIHALVKVSFSNLSWILSSIYASLRFLECYLLWKNLANVASIHSLPWLMIGDFNEVLLSDDKFVGRSVNFHRASNFRDYIDSCVSPEVVKHAWVDQLSLENAVISFTASSHLWNKEVFGNLFMKKKQLEARLKGFQTTIGIAFVPGPKGIDNAIIIQELLHTMSKKKGKSRVLFYPVKFSNPLTESTVISSGGLRRLNVRYTLPCSGTWSAVKSSAPIFWKVLLKGLFHRGKISSLSRVVLEMVAGILDSSPNGPFCSKDAYKLALPLKTLPQIHRNKFIFKESLLKHGLFFEVQNMAIDYLFFATRTSTLTISSVLKVKWIMPEINWVKLNTDGSSFGNPGLAGGGGII